MPQTVNANLSLSVRMPASEWDKILQVLRKAPYEMVANAIQNIVDQCTAGATHENLAPDP
jgi:hypothetical protein